MRRHQSKVALLSLGAAVAVLAALGSAPPGLLGRTRDEGVSKDRAAPAAREEALQGLRGSRAATGEGDCACCSGARGTCACCGHRARAVRPGSQLVARAEERQKDEKKTASAEAKAKGEAARKAIVDHQKALMEEDLYDCCIKPGCAFCSNAADMCPCAANLRKGGPVCPECWGGWQAGKGRLNGVKPQDVKVLPKEKMQMLYDMRSKNFEKAEK